MNKKKNSLLAFLLFILMGCSTDVSTPLPISTSHLPTEQILFPTKTLVTCPPRLDTKLPEPDSPENYVGKVFQFPYPDALEARFEGSVMGDNEHGTEYQLVFIVNQGTGQKMFWFEREICRDSSGGTFYEIIDTLTLTMDLEQQEVVSSRSCEINKVFDPEIVALGDRLPYSEKLNNIQQAWRANRQTERIEEISINGIQCFRESGRRTP